MSLTASSLRQNVYRILDEILETGVAVEIERRGRLLRIVPVDPPSKLKEIPERDYLVGDPESIVHVDWTDEWRP